MKVVEIVGSITTTLSNEDYEFLKLLEKYCKVNKTNVIPHTKLNGRQRIILGRLVDSHLVEYDWNQYTLREII